MRLKSLAALATGLLFATSVAAQTPAAKAADVPPAPLVAPALTPENTWNLDLSTGGRVSIQLRPDVAPGHVERIKTLTRQGFYDGVVFHRVIEGFMAQTGDPTGTGEGGSPLPDIKAEFNKLPHVRGAVSAARTDQQDTANSQFFIMFAPRLGLDGKYSVFGRVVSGIQHVDAITRGTGQNGEVTANPSRILRASIGTDSAAPPLAAAMAPVTIPAVQAPAPAEVAPQ